MRRTAGSSASHSAYVRECGFGRPGTFVRLGDSDPVGGRVDPWDTAEGSSSCSVLFLIRRSAQWLQHKVPALAETELRAGSGNSETLPWLFTVLTGARGHKGGPRNTMLSVWRRRLTRKRSGIGRYLQLARKKAALAQRPYI